MDEAIDAFLARLHEQSAEIRPCDGLPTDPADTCRELVLRDDRQEPRHPKHDPSDEPPQIRFDPPMPFGQSMMSEDVALQRRSGWHPAYDILNSAAPTMWAAVNRSAD